MSTSLLLRTRWKQRYRWIITSSLHLLTTPEGYGNSREEKETDSTRKFGPLHNPLNTNI